MRIIVLVLLVVAAHFSLTPFAPASAGKAWFMWPFAADSKPWLGFVGGLPRQSGSVVTPLLAGLAGLGLLAAALGLFGVLVPANGWPALVIISASASILLYVLYFRVWAILPIVIDAALRASYTEPARRIVTPKTETFFAGKLEYAKLSLFENLISQAMKAQVQDLRDWAKIRVWAEGIYPTLASA